MKNIITIGVLILTILSCKAQTISIEQHGSYLESGNGIPDNTTYIKDVSNVLEKFVGTWKGTHNGKSYEFRIIKTSITFDGLKSDELHLRYKITSGSTVVEDILNEPTSNQLVMIGWYLLGDGRYLIHYQGREARCGQDGTLFVSVTGNTMRAILDPANAMVFGPDCPPGTDASHIMPLTEMTLTKQ